jgi:uncharacterized membrane protein YkoI
LTTNREWQICRVPRRACPALSQVRAIQRAVTPRNLDLNAATTKGDRRTRRKRDARRDHDQPGGRQGGAANHGSSPVRDDETALNATDAAKVKAAALKAVSGATVYRVETDAGDGAYEAHMTKADGTEVTVKLDKNFKVTAVETGMGKGDPAPSGQSGGSRGSSSQTGTA